MSSRLEQPRTAVGRSQRLARIGAVTIALVWLAAVVAVLPAAAHTELEGSEPAADATVDEPVDRVTVTFADALLQDGDHGLRVEGPNGEEVASGGAEVEPGVLELELPAGLATPGEHTVRWIIIAADSDEQRGEFTFTATETAVAAPDDTSGESGDDEATEDATDATEDAASPRTEEEATAPDETPSDEEPVAGGAAADDDGGSGLALWLPVGVAVVIATGAALRAARRGEAEG